MKEEKKHQAHEIKLSGKLEIVVRDKDGKVKEREKLSNLIVNAGKEFVAKLINGVVTNFFDHIAIGTGTTAVSATDTALELEITTGGGERALATLSYVAPYIAKFANLFTFTASFAVTESGIFDAITAGNMLARQTFAAKNVVAGDSLEITWEITVS